jgi:hypothetical protein
MKNRWLLNLALALLVGALVLIAVFRPGKEPESAGTPLTGLTPESVTTIRLQRPKQPDIVLEKKHDAWQLTAPRVARANGFRVNELTRLAATPVKTRFPAVPGELEKYGLAAPLATAVLNDDEIRFGAMHPLNQELYVLHAGQVQLVPATTLRTVLTPLDDWFHPGLLEDKIKIVSLQLPGFRLTQNEQGAWVRTPAREYLSSDHINRFVDEWRFARALSVTSTSGKPPVERVTITVADGDQTRALVFGVLTRKPELVLVRLDEKLEYHFPADAVGRLLELNPEQDPAPAAPKP